MLIPFRFIISKDFGSSSLLLLSMRSPSPVIQREYLDTFFMDVTVKCFCLNSMQDPAPIDAFISLGVCPRIIKLNEGLSKCM
jgi:hypothetical protein